MCLIKKDIALDTQLIHRLMCCKERVMLRDDHQISWPAVTDDDMWRVRVCAALSRAVSSGVPNHLMKGLGAPAIVFVGQTRLHGEAGNPVSEQLS
jgi:hypothetical protein